MTTEEKLKLIETTLDDGKGENIEIINLADKTQITDYFVICTGNSDVHVRALCDRVEEAVRLAGGGKPRDEGREEKVWLLMDYGDIVVHIMREEQRAHYNLEDLWKNMPKSS